MMRRQRAGPQRRPIYRDDEKGRDHGFGCEDGRFCKDENVARSEFNFKVGTRLCENESELGLGRTGTIETPHGSIKTPAFIPVGTKGTVKTVLPESMRELGAQAILANAYHLFLQPGSDLIEEAGGLGRFMNWSGPTLTDSGGFQVLSLGAGFKKILAMDATKVRSDEIIAEGKDRLAHVDDDGVTFKSHIDGTMHRFTPEVSMRVQYEIGADIVFAFDECTTLVNTRGYQERSVERTHLWAERCVAAHRELVSGHPDRPYQALWGVVQGAQYEDLRRHAARGLAELELDGFGIGGALEKQILGSIVRWVCEELPEHQPRHLLGIGEPDDLFNAIENGADTFDCVTPSRIARNGGVYSRSGRYNITNAANRRSFEPLDRDCGCYVCTHYTRSYVRHLLKAKEIQGLTLTTIHNEHFIVGLVDEIRRSIEAGTYLEFKQAFLGEFYSGRGAASL
jgi:queuine tRNA-ribosyltransferase